MDEQLHFPVDADAVGGSGIGSVGACEHRNAGFLQRGDGSECVGEIHFAVRTTRKEFFQICDRRRIDIGRETRISDERCAAGLAGDRFVHGEGRDDKSVMILGEFREVRRWRLVFENVDDGIGAGFDGIARTGLRTNVHDGELVAFVRGDNDGGQLFFR